MLKLAGRTGELGSEQLMEDEDAVSCSCLTESTDRLRSTRGFCREKIAIFPINFLRLYMC